LGAKKCGGRGGGGGGGGVRPPGSASAVSNVSHIW